MPQIAFFVAGFSTFAGAAGYLLAWDRYDRGPSAADDFNHEGCELYSLVSPLIGATLPVKMVTKGPISIPEENCPVYPDGFPDQDLINHFELKPGGTALSYIADVTFELLNESSRVYGITPENQTRKVEAADWSLISSIISFQDRLVLQPWEDPLEGFAQLIDSTTPSKEIWRSLMSPNDAITWLEI